MSFGRVFILRESALKNIDILQLEVDRVFKSIYLVQNCIFSEYLIEF